MDTATAPRSTKHWPRTQQRRPLPQHGRVSYLMGAAHSAATTGTRTATPRRCEEQHTTTCNNNVASDPSQSPKRNRRQQQQRMSSSRRTCGRRRCRRVQLLRRINHAGGRDRGACARRGHQGRAHRAAAPLVVGRGQQQAQAQRPLTAAAEPIESRRTARTPSRQPSRAWRLDAAASARQAHDSLLDIAAAAAAPPSSTELRRNNNGRHSTWHRRRRSRGVLKLVQLATAEAAASQGQERSARGRAARTMVAQLHGGGRLGGERCIEQATLPGRTPSCSEPPPR